MNLEDQRRGIVRMTGPALHRCRHETHQNAEPAQCEEGQKEVAVPLMEGKEAAAGRHGQPRWDSDFCRWLHWNSPQGRAYHAALLKSWVRRRTPDPQLYPRFIHQSILF